MAAITADGLAESCSPSRQQESTGPWRRAHPLLPSTTPGHGVSAARQQQQQQLAQQPQPSQLQHSETSEASAGPDTSEPSAAALPAAAVAALALFSGGVRRLSVVDEAGEAVEMFAHEGVLCKLPYFAARKGQWCRSPGEVERLLLPVCCPHSSFGAVLNRLYSIDSHWSPADWARVLGADDLPAAYGVLMLSKMFLASDLIEEIVAVVRRMASDPKSLSWLQNMVNGLDLPELDSFCETPGPVCLDATALRQAALSAMTGPSVGRHLFEALLAVREAQGLAPEDVEVLISVLRDHESYATRGRTHSTGSVRPRRAADAGSLRQSSACDFFRPIKIPIEGFSELWQLIMEGVEREPALFQSALTIFQSLQWLEYDVNANRHGQESIAGSRRLRHLPDASSKQALRRAYASYLLLGLRLKDRDQISSDVFLEAFSCGSLSSTQAPEGLGGGKRRNLLHFATARRPTSNYVDSMDLLATILSSADGGLSSSVLSVLVSNFREWQWAFSARAVCSLSDDQQTCCAQTCTRDWLTGEVCAVLRGKARAVARSRLATHIGRLSATQRAFMWEGV
mmetsp:Transcript_70267/g.195567  ORF Transcript_70267/g.195567 Transcript_70267/m.195567 type:complete len:569 (-) Transcript_70267:390-2096(-)